MKTLLILSFLSLSFIADSQCCPYINNIEVIPAAPTTADNIKIVTSVTTPNQGSFIYSTHSVNGSIIEIEACYLNGMLTATQTYLDTLNVGILGAGNYSVDLTAYTSSDTICNYNDSTSSTVNFSVIEHTNEIHEVKGNIGKLYPNPTKGSFTIDLPKQTNVTDICIHTISGKIVHQGIFTKEVLVNLNSGVYLVQLLSEGTIIGYHRLLID